MLRFIALSGTTSVTENLYVYEADGKMLIIDCGVGFPDLEMPGVELVIPDFNYIVKNKEKVVGIVVSQGHEDHIGALPFLLREIDTPVWATPLVSEFLKDKFQEYDLRKFIINTFDAEKGDFNVGPFKIHPFRVTHSVPDTVGFAIDTPEGRIFHVPEHKMDQNPIDGMAFDTNRAKWLANEKRVLFLASDCLGANKPGFTKSETEIEDKMLKIIQGAKQAVFATAISSNIGRFQQMIRVAEKVNRKVVFVGRSIQKKIEVAHKLGYINYPEDLVVSYKQLRKLQRNKVMYIISGCYGQVGSSLYRVSLGEHDNVQIEAQDTVLFSADPAPPYTKESEDFIIDELFDKDVDVHYYDHNEGLYVSGHGSQQDILELFNIAKPKYFIPIGGTIRFMHAYKRIAVESGVNPGNVFLLKPGENIVFENGNASLGQAIPVKRILVHGLGIGDIGKVVLGERSILGTEGVVVVVIKVNRNSQLVGTPKVISKGFVFEKLSKEMLLRAENKLKDQIVKGGKVNSQKIEKITSEYLEKYFYTKIKRTPMIVPVVVEV